MSTRLLYCPRCQSYNAERCPEPSPSGVARAYCTNVGCGWEGTLSQARGPVGDAEELAALRAVVDLVIKRRCCDGDDACQTEEMRAALAALEKVQ